MVMAWLMDFILLRNILSTMGKGAHDFLVYIYWLVVWLYFFRGMCSGQLNPDTWLSLFSAFTGDTPYCVDAVAASCSHPSGNS